MNSILNPQPSTFSPIIRGQNRLEVRAAADSDEHELILIGAIGKSWWDDTGITEQEVRDALKSVPAGKRITAKINSEGGSVKEGLGIYNAFKERRAEITAKITGYALSIASVFPLGAGRVISPKSAIWMLHKAWAFSQGNADDMRKAAEMLDTHDEAMLDIYSAETGKARKEISAAMDDETWIKGADAVAWGLADETDPDEEDMKEECDMQASVRRPLPQNYLNRCKHPEILNAFSAAPKPKQGADATHTNQNQMNKKLIVALLKDHGIEASETETDEQLANKLQTIPKATASLPAVDPNVITSIQAQLAAEKRARIEDKINAYVDQNRITKATAKIMLEKAVVSTESETEVFAALEETQPMAIGGEPAGAHIFELDPGPAVSKNGVQGTKIIPELDNIFATHKEPRDRYEAMKAEWPRLLRIGFRKDNGAVAANTFSATITTNFLILGVVTKLYNRFAAAKLFTRDNSVDPYKPLASGIMKFNTTTTSGTQVQTNATDFEALGAGGDSTIDAVTITNAQYTSGGHITNAQLNSGFRVADIVEAKLVDLAAKVTQVFTAPITAANFVTNAALVCAPAAFGFSELADLQGTLKKSRIFNLLLDGEYLARISNTPSFFQTAGTLGAGNTGAWTAFGWDNIALNTDWTGAGANVRGFACNPQAIGITTGLPINPPEGIPGNIVQIGTAQLQDVQIAIATYAWFSALTRTFHFTYDIVGGAALLDETAGRLITSA